MFEWIHTLRMVLLIRHIVLANRPRTPLRRFYPLNALDTWHVSCAFGVNLKDEIQKPGAPQMFPLNPSAIVPSGPLIGDLQLDMAPTEVERTLQEVAVFHSTRAPVGIA